MVTQFYICFYGPDFYDDQHRVIEKINQRNGNMSTNSIKICVRAKISQAQIWMITKNTMEKGRQNEMKRMTYGGICSIGIAEHWRNCLPHAWELEPSNSNIFSLFCFSLSLHFFLVYLSPLVILINIWNAYEFDNVYVRECVHMCEFLNICAFGLDCVSRTHTRTHIFGHEKFTRNSKSSETCIIYVHKQRDTHTYTQIAHH